MIDVLSQSHDDVVGVRASGVLTDADYKRTLIPLLEKTIAQHGRARLLVEIADTLAGWEMAAAWDDAAFGFAHRADFSKIAMVGGPQWIVWSAKLFAPFIAGAMKIFSAGQSEQAWAWIDEA
jgi:hypothetical protein